MALKIETLPDIPKDRKVVVMGTSNNLLVKKYCPENKLQLTAENPGAEGYILQVKSNAIVIGGSDDQGAFYGLQSLRQLIEARERKENPGSRRSGLAQAAVQGNKALCAGSGKHGFF